ncbi:MAG: glutaredoxin family protein [Thermomicrobiales bacterium]
MPEPIALYGATDCDDTARVRARLVAFAIPFSETNIDHDADAACFVRVVNSGYRSTPTRVFGAGRAKRVVTDPTDAELDQVLREAGYTLPAQATPEK